MERKTFNIIFYVRKNKENIDKEVPLFMRLTINGRRWDSALKIKIHPSKWDAKRQVAIDDDDERYSNLVNETIESFRWKSQWPLPHLAGLY